MKILFEKYEKDTILYSWTRLFNNIDDLLKFMKEHKEYLLGDEYYSIKIRAIKEE